MGAADIFKNIMSGGENLNVDRANNMYDVENRITEAYAYEMEQSNQYTEEDIKNFVSERNAATEKDREKTLEDIDDREDKAIFLNTLGLIASAGTAGLGAAAKTNGLTALNGGSRLVSNGSRIAGKVTNAVKTSVTTGKLSGVASKLSGVGTKIATKVNVVGKIASNKAVQSVGKTVSTVGRGALKAVGSTAKLTGKAAGYTVGTLGGAVGQIVNVSSKVPLLGTVVKVSPFIATQLYTRNKASEKATELDARLETLNQNLKSMEDNKGKFGENFENRCNEFVDSYNTASTALVEKYSNGEISNSEYEKAMDEMSKEYSDKLKEMKEEFPNEMDSQLYREGLTHAANLLTDEQLEDFVDSVSRYREQNEQDPTVLQDCKVIAENRNGTAESNFGRFWKSLNSTIIKYVPAVAYVEAVALKAVDSTYDFIRDAIKGHDERSKYQNESITSLAKSIQTDCAEHLEKRDVAKETSAKLLSSSSMDTFTAEDQQDLVQLEAKHNPVEEQQQDDGYALV